MAEQKWTPTPWAMSNRQGESTIVSGAETGQAVAVCVSPRYGLRSFQEHDGPRIVSCVNALDGLVPAKLPELLEAVEMVISDFDLPATSYSSLEWRAIARLQRVNAELRQETP